MSWDSTPSVEPIPLFRFKSRHSQQKRILNLNKGNSLIKSHEV